jgi:glycosyltransferase involved in cell wall biosynthesis
MKRLIKSLSPLKSLSPRIVAARRILANANAARDRHDWAVAAALYEVYLAEPAYSLQAHIWVQLGHARKESKNLDGALKAYHRAIELAPSIADTYLHLGHLQYRMGATEQGIASLKEALRHDPDIGDAREAVELFTDETVSSNVRQRKTPRPAVDTAWYAWFYRDVAASGLSPAVHHARIGAPRDRPSSPPAPPLASAMAPAVHEPWCAPGGNEWVWSFRLRLQQRMAALATMALDNPFPGAIAFSITTTVYDTKPSFLWDLAKSIAAQAFQSYEWILLDNGSSDPRTIAAMKEIAASDSRIKLHRVDTNLHIIGGNRFALGLVAGRYVVPVDSDDLIYPDSLALFANVLRDQTDLPAIMYSDEQKVTEAGEPFELMWRSKFSRASAIETVPAGHLMALSAALAHEVGLYTADYARGSHDWDSWLRMTERDVRVVHVPEVLYGWRIHAASTAGSSQSKSYISTSQSEVIAQALQRRKLQHLFETEQLFGDPGWYKARRIALDAPLCDLDFVVGADQQDLTRLSHNLTITSAMPGRKRVLYPQFRSRDVDMLRSTIAVDEVEWTAYIGEDDLLSKLNDCEPAVVAKVLVSSSLRIRQSDAIWDGIGTLELDPRAGLVSGPIVSVNNIVLTAGYLAGIEGRIATPYAGWAKADVPGDYWQLRRSISVAPTLFVVIRREALVAAGPLGGMDVNDALFGLDFCQRLLQAGYGIVQTPGMETERDRMLSRIIGEGSAEGMLKVDKALAEGILAPCLSPHLSVRGNRFGKIARPSERGTLATLDISEVGPAVPLNLQVDPDLEDRPTINLLLPVNRMTSMSGGPNTALNLAYRLADIGFPLRIISTDHPGDADQTALWQHVQSISGVPKRLAHAEMVDGCDRNRPLSIGANDVFLATAWWTAQMAKHASVLVRDKPFLYLVQDYEPLFYPTSTLHALSIETYNLNYLPIINTTLLRDYLASHAIGRNAECDFVTRALVFEPAIDRESFFPEDNDRARRRLLFYARPTHGVRNIYPIGVAALRLAIERGILSPLDWDFVGMGEQFEPVDLGHGATLTCAPWLGFDDYAREMRHSDVLLSLMLSPHPSYPPLEMGQCNGIVVTNTFANKTAERMKAFSSRIIAVEATVEAVTDGLAEAVRRVGNPETTASSALPGSWDESFADIVPELARRLSALGLRTDGRLQSLAAVKMPGTEQAGDPYADFLAYALAKRADLCAAEQVPGLLSFSTVIWNTPPQFLEVLSLSMQAQHGGTLFEWFVLDNGSTDPDTLVAIERLQKLPFVHFERSETNLGIVGGTRYCLERTKGRYFISVDHDDYVFPDAARVMTWYLQKHAYPPAMYSDETMLAGTRQFLPYMKPDWDPVLFVHSCYIAHLYAIDRKLALDCGAYSDRQTEASPDWDAFTRLSIAGHVPVHVPEVLYSWRIHEQSTAGNIGAKPYVARSQQRVLERFLESRPGRHRFQVQASPLFKANADWWFRRKRIDPRPIATFLVSTVTDGGAKPDLRVAPTINHRVVPLHLDMALTELLPHLRRCVDEKRLVHLMASGAHPDDDEWAWEAMGLFELFPDTVMVGGCLHSYGVVLGASYYFGFGRGWDSPDRTRRLEDSGYFGQLWKPHSVSAVAGEHCVVDPAFLIRVIEATKAWSPSLAALGCWAGAVAREEGNRVIFSPFLRARTDIDWSVLVSHTERGRFTQAYSHLMPETGLLSPNVGLMPDNAFVPTRRDDFIPARSGVVLADYPSWFTARQAARAIRYPALTQGASFSILTALYSGSDPEVFELTAQSMRGQRYSNYEWVIVAQGPISPTLEIVLRQVGREPRVRVLRLPQNLGIIGGMRYGLEAATGDYVLPLDGDDLLTEDCLQVLANVIGECDEPPAYLYSDEDIISGGVLNAPFLRPVWDPVLDLENSWIWHVGVFRRDLGLTLGIYTDKGSEYCQDWDTVYRFTNAGHKPLHVDEVLYHWRHHAQSTSNRANPGEGSSKSVQHLLTRKIADRGLSDLCEIAPFPIYRGAMEWWVQRKPINLPRVRCIVVDMHSDGMPKLPPALQDDRRIMECGPSFFKTLEEDVAALDAGTLVMLLSDRVAVSSFDGVLEAIKLFEFHDNVAVVSGRVIDGDLEIARGLMTDAGGRLRAPFEREPLSSPNPFAVRWKPVSISVPIIDLCVIRASFLLSALKMRRPDCTVAEFGLWLGAFAVEQGQRVAFSPLVSGEIKGDALRRRDARLDQLCWLSFRKTLVPDGARKTGGLGSSAYLSKAFMD